MRHTTNQSNTRSAIWAIFNTLRKGRQEFGVSGPALASLQALLGFLPDNGPLIIYASNKSITARNMKSEASLRRHLAELEAHDLIRRHRSSNGKRYRVKNPHGEDMIFGIDVSPLLDAADAIEAAAARAKEKAELIRYHRHQVYALLAEIAEDTGPEGQASETIIDEATIATVRKSLRRETKVEILSGIADKLRAALSKTCKMSGSPVQNERHIQESQKEYLLNEPADACENPVLVADVCGQRKIEEDTAQDKPTTGGSTANIAAIERLSVTDIVRACPQAMQFADQPLRSIEDLGNFAWKLGTFVPIPEALMRKAAEKHGILAVVLTVLGLVERGEKIRNAAGYFRSVLLGKRAHSFTPAQFLMSAGA